MSIVHQAMESAATWVKAHEDVLAIASERACLERREGRCLVLAQRQKVHRHLGYGGFFEYTDRYLGYSARTTQSKLRTAEALDTLPELARAQQEGRLHASAVRELARVATPATEAAWIEAATGRRLREIERLVSGRARGDHPKNDTRPELEKHVLRFEVSAETLAAFRDAMERLSDWSGERLDDDSALLLMARTIASQPPPAADKPPGTAEPANDNRATDTSVTACSVEAGRAETSSESVPGSGRARYQISIMRCDGCRRAFQLAGPDLVEVKSSIVAMAECDGQHIGATHVGVGENTPRATQSIPPSVRRHVLARDRHCCQLPGCRHIRSVDVHHIVPRAEGGSHDPANLTVLCTTHHRAIHEGRLLLAGHAPDGVEVRHADGTPYGGAPSARDADVAEKVFRGLRGLGFKERDAREATRRAGRELASTGATQTAESLLRAALVCLGQV